MGDDLDLEELIGSLLDEEAPIADRARKLVEIATLAGADMTGERCGTTAQILNVNRSSGQAVRCSLPPAHGGDCHFRASWASPAASEEPVEDLDDLVSWAPDPAPLQAEALGLLAKLPALPELDRVTELIGQLAVLAKA